MSNLTVVILALNEELHIERCLRSAFQLTDQVFVVDSHSTDQTVNIAASLGAKVWQHEFKNYASQLAWALSHLPIETDWVMRMDADEIVSPKLARDIALKLSSAESDVNGFLVCLYVNFKGAYIRHGGFPLRLLRIWRNGSASIEQRWMDEHMIVQSGRVELLNGEYVDHNLKNITWWTTKHNSYATREAIDHLSRKYDLVEPSKEGGALTFQARYKRWLKDNLYAHFPLGSRALLYFIYRMVICLGVLDGFRGFTFHFLQGFWYRFLVDIKVHEVERCMRSEGLSCVEAIRRELGIDLGA
jgi:glycosyltransferase involved in cell wall biosynthesis